jgi:hypothetical protein
MNSASAKKHPFVLLAFACGAVALTAACNRDRSRDGERPGVVSERETTPPKANADDQDKSGTTTITGASWMENGAAIDRIVATRCAREVACSNVGADKHFGSPENCVREVRKNMADDLKVSECPGGIDGAALDKCLDMIRNESCTNPIESLGRLATCRTGELCMRTEMPHR